MEIDRIVVLVDPGLMDYMDLLPAPRWSFLPQQASLFIPALHFGPGGGGMIVQYSISPGRNGAPCEARRWSSHTDTLPFDPIPGLSKA